MPRDKPEQSPWVYGNETIIKGAVDAFVALRNFKRWVRKNREILPEFEHAMAFTKKDIIRFADADAQGLAYVRSICSPSSVSLVEDVGGMATIAVAAHELGHSLGASHDGGRRTSKCKIKDNFMMVPAASGKKDKITNSFKLSKCSKRLIESFLLTHPARLDCLLAVEEEDTVSFQGVAGYKIAGQQFDLHQQCRMAFGEKYRFCDKSEYEVSQICHRLWCRDATLKRHAECFSKNYLPALSGTSCAHKMWCQEGVCIEDENAPEQQNCEFGDRSASFCLGLIYKQPRACFTSTFSRFCCSSCKTMKVFGKLFV